MEGSAPAVPPTGAFAHGSTPLLTDTGRVSSSRGALSTIVAKTVAGLRWHRHEHGDVPLLDDVAEAAERMRQSAEDERAAREELREKIRAARAEGIPFSVIARAAKLSREWVRRLHAGN
jgi:hypothetical protein